MREVTESEFWAEVKQRDCCPRPVGRWPYTSVFLTPDMVEVGRIVETLVADAYPIDQQYFLTETE